MVDVKIIEQGNEVILDLSSAQSAGGKTGSTRVKDDQGNYYQYKPPINSNSSLVRRVKANHLDTENFGEVLAARIAKAYDSNTTETTSRVPDLSFVNNGGAHLAIASKYLKGEKGATVQTLDDYLGVPKGKSHITLVTGKTKPEMGIYNIDANPKLKEHLALGVALSAKNLDHDVNPGNMIVITEANGEIRLGRIDNGHSFNDLRRTSFMGGKEVHPNGIIDFFNRNAVDGIGNAGRSKLWRDYPGLIPSKEMAAALKEVANQPGADDRVKKAILDVKNEILELLQDPRLDKEQIISSFQVIAERLTGPIPKLSQEERIDTIFDRITEATLKSTKQMDYAADIMGLQVKIQQAIKENKPTEPLKEAYDKLAKNTEHGPFAWIRESEKSPIFQGNFEQFVEHAKKTEKVNQLLVEVDNCLKDPNRNKSDKKVAGDLKSILVNPKKSVEEKFSQLDKKYEPNWFERLVNFLTGKSSDYTKAKDNQPATITPIDAKEVIEQFNDFKSKFRTMLKQTSTIVENVVKEPTEDVSNTRSYR